MCRCWLRWGRQHHGLAHADRKLKEFGERGLRIGAEVMAELIGRGLLKHRKSRLMHVLLEIRKVDFLREHKCHPQSCRGIPCDRLGTLERPRYALITDEM